MIRLIPVIYAPGNHDFGIHTFKFNEVPHNKHQPGFKHFLPQSTHNNSVPDLKNRKSYNGHRIGNTLLILSLDNGYIERMEGEQSNFIENELYQRDYKVKLAHYHETIFPARMMDFNRTIVRKGKAHWVPHFDKYNLTAAIENHTHLYKRSKRMKYYEEHPEGTVYLGEGSWSQMWPQPLGDLITDSILYAAIMQVVWVIRIDETNIVKFEARDVHNEIFDKFEIEVK